MDLLSLQWKATFRSPQWEAKLSIKVIMGFLVVYFAGAFVLLSGVVYPILFDKVLDREPLEVANSYLLYVFFSELVMRYFLQQLPVTNIQSLILLPISKKRVIRYSLFKNAISVFNLSPFILYLPFAISMYKDDYLPLQVTAWWGTMFLLTLSVSFFVFLVNKSKVAFWGTLVTMAFILLGDYYDVFDVSQKGGYFFDDLVQKPVFFFWAFAPLVISYGGTYIYLKKQFYLDKGLAKKKGKVRQGSFSFLESLLRDGWIIQNDLRLIARNARPRQVLLMGFLFLFYGLLFYTQEIYDESAFFRAFAALFITGGFTLTFGNYVPAWDSSYYPLLMTQNISYKDYLLSKWNLMAMMTLVVGILATPYVYFGWDVLLLIWACTFFTIGIGTWITLLGGLLNKTPMKLNTKAKAFENTQAFSLNQFLLVLPKLLFPVLLYTLPALALGPWGGIAALTVTGVLGILFKQKLALWVTARYKKQKYSTLAAFKKHI